MTRSDDHRVGPEVDVVVEHDEHTVTFTPPDSFTLEAFQAQPRLADLAVSPDGTRAVIGVSTPDAKGTRFVSALWQLNITGVGGPARRLTRSTKGEKHPRFVPSGDLLFLSGRPDPADTSDDTDTTALWLLPADGGEARPVVTRPLGIEGFATASAADTVVVVAPTLPSSTDDAEEQQAVDDRREGKVTAILHDRGPVRFWDHDLGPGANRLLVVAPAPRTMETRLIESEARDLEWTTRDLTGPVGHALDHAAPDLSPDGSTVVTAWLIAEAGGDRRATVVAIDTDTGVTRPLADDPAYEFTAPKISPDGRSVAMLRTRRATPSLSAAVDLVLAPLAGGDVRELAPNWNGWPHSVRWTPSGDSVVVNADLNGRSPLFRIPVDGGGPTPVNGVNGSFSDFEVLEDGDVVALSNAVDAAPTPVRIPGTGPLRGALFSLPSPVTYPVATTAGVPGTLTELEGVADDGTPLRAWLVLPRGASETSPAPLVLWVHGGPLSSWNAWSWRWNPWLLAARGYAVLLPDPALSTGYGQHMIDRGWGAWGGAPYTDVMTMTDVALAHPAIDPRRPSMMGGSFGGYMANWIAGHTDRFVAIVSHASLWNLETFGGTTDDPWYWRRELSTKSAQEYSPHRFADRITTPMLVIHGDRDYRVPIGEGLSLWSQLNAQSGDPAAAPMPHKFLYFPDENHWVLTPQHATIWYETVFAFLDHHVRGEPWRRPARLG